MNPLILIPARMAATRLPGKPLADIRGKPMILRAWGQALASGYRVAVAAGDAEIVAVILAAGGEAVLTDPALPSGSDRIQAAIQALDPAGAHDVVVNLQGDMPFADPGLARACVEVLAREPSCDIATLVAPEAAAEDRTNPDVVKAVLAMAEGERHGRALYFTRSTLYGDGPVWRHVGLYGYRREALNRFCAGSPSPLERREKLEQLRALEMGLSIWAAVIGDAPLSVDNPADLEAARAQAVGSRQFDRRFGLVIPAGAKRRAGTGWRLSDCPGQPSGLNRDKGEAVGVVPDELRSPGREPRLFPSPLFASLRRG